MIIVISELNYYGKQSNTPPPHTLATQKRNGKKQQMKSVKIYSANQDVSLKTLQCSLQHFS